MWNRAYRLVSGQIHSTILGLIPVSAEPSAAILPNQAAVATVVGGTVNHTNDGGTGGRRTARISRRLDIHCKSKRNFQAVMRDMSQGGVNIDCDEPLVVDEQVDLKIHIEKINESLAVTGRVVHVCSVGEGVYQAGLKFGSQSREQRRAIETFLSHLMETPG